MAFYWSNSGFNHQAPPYEDCSPNLLQIWAYLRDRWSGSWLGCHVDRNIVGGSSLSAHAFGAAHDVRFPSRATTLVVLDWLIANHVPLGVLRLNDYAAQRVWDNDRKAWKSVSLQTGDWIHIETTSAMFGNSTPVAQRNLGGTSGGSEDMTPTENLWLQEVNHLIKSYLTITYQAAVLARDHAKTAAAQATLANAKLDKVQEDLVKLALADLNIAGKVDAVKVSVDLTNTMLGEAKAAIEDLKAGGVDRAALVAELAAALAPTMEAAADRAIRAAFDRGAG